MPGPERRAVARAFARAAAGYESADFLHQEIRTRLLERLDLVSLRPDTILDLGAGPPRETSGLHARYPDTTLLAVDLVPAMLGAAATPWHRLGADAARLPLPDGCVDLVVAGMLLHWCEEPAAVLAEIRRVLRFPGLLLVSTLGPDTLQELRAAWAAVDRHSHTLGFPDMHDLGDALVGAGFAEPVVDRHVVTVTYREVGDLARDLRGVGAADLSHERRRTLTGPRHWSAMASAFARQRRGDGRVPVTMEIVCAHAWATPSHRDAAGEIAVPLDRLRRRS